MQSLLLPFCVMLFFTVIALRIALRPKDQPKRKLGERFKYARVLILALLGLMAVGYRLQKINHELDAKTPYEPGPVEKWVMQWSKR